MDNKLTKKHFIFTFSPELKEELIKNNFTLMSDVEGKFTFLNDGILNFDKDEEKIKKIHFTNMLCMN